MPLLSGRLILDQPSLAAAPEIATVPVDTYLETVGNMTATWIDPDGVEWPLSNIGDEPGWFTVNGPSGWGASTFEITSDVLPRGGEQPRFVRLRPKRIQWPLYVGGRTHAEFVQRYRTVVDMFTKTSIVQAPGYLRVARDDGSSRVIVAWYEEGLEGESGENHLYAKPVITLYCPEGSWRGDTPVVARREFDPGVVENASFYNPFMRLTSSRAINANALGGDGGGGGDDDPVTRIINAGSMTAWPAWKITGPMTAMRCWNNTLQTRFGLTYTLRDEQTITITTDQPTVRGPGDANLSKFVDWFNPAGTELWPLTPGPNDIRFEVDGAGTGTSIEMSFVPRFTTC